MASLRWLGRAALAAALASFAACTGDTGILVRVTRDDTLAAGVPRLHVAVGVAAPDHVTVRASGQSVDLPTYIDGVPATETVDTSGVDLATAPFELLLSPSTEFDMAAGLELAAAGLDTQSPPQLIGFGAIGHQVHFVRGEVLAYDITLTAVADPTADPGRRSCGTLIGDGVSVYACRGGCVRYAGADGDRWIGASDDIDCDGDPHGTDCDDYDWTVNHAATDLCGNGVNDDCVGGIDDPADRDGDTLTPCDGDCVDNPTVPGSAQIHPGATDGPDGVDNDCSGGCDEPDDVDTDTYTASGFRTTSPDATDASCAAAAPDCNDRVATIHPGATEVDRNGFDDDCDGHCDVDGDGDGYTVGDGQKGVVDPPAAGTARCAVAPADCNDDPAFAQNGTTAAQIYPGAPELCDALDDDCDGKCDDGLDTDGDGYTTCGTVADVGGGSCTFTGATCVPNTACDCAEGVGDIHPGGVALERCDGYDSACDGVRFDATTACFALDAMNACRVGTRACDDLTPPGGFAACVPGTTPAPDGACSAFASCASDPDPLACVADQVNGTRLDCVAQLTMTVPVALCAPPTTYAIGLPAAAGTQSCAAVTWDIIGGPEVGAWTVGLAEANSTGATTAQTLTGACQPNLIIDAVTVPAGAAAAPPAASVLLIARRGMVAQAVVVTIGGHVGAVCPADNAVLCTTTGG